MANSITKMTVQELVDPFASLMLSHPHLYPYMERAQELARRNKMLEEALKMARIQALEAAQDYCTDDDCKCWERIEALKQEGKS